MISPNNCDANVDNYLFSGCLACSSMLLTPMNSFVEIYIERIAIELTRNEDINQRQNKSAST